jgi:hypothetical protein
MRPSGRVSGHRRHFKSSSPGARILPARRSALAEGRDTPLSFAQRGFRRADEGYARVNTGWAYYLVRLQHHLETGQGAPGIGRTAHCAVRRRVAKMNVHLLRRRKSVAATKPLPAIAAALF